VKDINEYLDAKAVIMIVMIIVVAICGILCFRQWEDYDSLRDRTLGEEQRNRVLQSELSALRRQREENSDSNFEEEMQARMPSEPDEAGLIEVINNAFDNTSGYVLDIRFHSREEKSGYIEMPFTIYMMTNYKTLVQILRQLQDSDRYIRLTGFTISANDELGALSVVVNASAFSYITT
jgi:Tfp pilus assembly protein PilO